MNPKRSPLKSEGALLAQLQWRRKLQSAFLQRNRANRLSCVRRLRQSPSYQAGSELYYTGFTADEIDRLLADDAVADGQYDDDLRLYEASCELQFDDSDVGVPAQVLCPVCQRNYLHESDTTFVCACSLQIPRSDALPDLVQLRLALSALLGSHPHPCRPRFQFDHSSLVLICDRCQATMRCP